MASSDLTTDPLLQAFSVGDVVTHQSTGDALWELRAEDWIGDSPAFVAMCIRSGSNADGRPVLGAIQSFSVPAFMTLYSRDILCLDWMLRDAWNLGRLG